MKNIYCISGLGADHRIFQKLDIPGTKLVHVPWAEYDKHDEMSCYAQKMAYQIKEEAPIVLGVSFGGMLATEMKIQNPQQKTIIVSSAKSKNELPQMGGFLQFMVKSKLVPYGLAKTPNKYTFRLFGAETEEEKHLLAGILHDSDAHFLKWASKAMIEWHNETVPEGITHIHGTADRIIPVEKVHADYLIDGGGHIMIYNRAEEIRRLIAEHI